MGALTEKFVSTVQTAKLAEQLHKAGTQYDGHVTFGSMEAQLAVVRTLLREIKGRIQVAGDFGEFDLIDGYPETVARDIIDGVMKAYGL